jgi:hypothetical protein
MKARKNKDAAKGAALAAASIAGATVFTLGAAVVGVAVGVPRLQANLAAQAAASPAKAVFSWPMSEGRTELAWPPESVRHELLADAQRELDRAPDPFNVEALRLVAESAAGSGWFEQIKAVRRERGGIVRIDGQWRSPAAVVRRDHDYLIARKGEVLDLAYDRGASPFKVIVGARQEAPKAAGRLVAGQVWPGADVRAGLDLLALLSSRPWINQVAGVDVSDYSDKKQLTILTAAGNRIVWGGAPTDAIPGQVSSEVKLKRLDVLQHQFGAIDARHRIVEVCGPRTLVDDSASANAS